MKFLPISDNAARQAIDAATIWAEYLQAQEAARPYAGGMYWKREGAYEYLVKTLAGKKQQRLGPRTPETEQIHASFHARKAATESRLASLSAALDEAQRQNKALRAGRTPDIVVRLLNTLREAGLEKHFRVVGTHALYAYESQAGVRITQGAMATQDVDLLWDASRRVEFLADLQRDAGSILAVLHKVDPSFQRRDDALKNESAINDRGFEVEFLRREAEAGDPHPLPVFSQPVISATGRMATMHTIDPRTFIDFKRWMAGLADRDAVKRRRDALQADVVEQMLLSGLITSAMAQTGD